MLLLLFFSKNINERIIKIIIIAIITAAGCS